MQMACILAGIVPPDIKRDVCDIMEIMKQMEQETHSLFGHIPDRSKGVSDSENHPTSLQKSYNKTSGRIDQGTLSF